MELLAIIAFVVAIVLFVLAGVSYPRENPPYIQLGWFGMVALTVGLWVQFM
jgi:protein-S-isoprenylcysteine O-methyltransferase Ste14